MDMFPTPGEIRSWSDVQRSDGATIGLVPTMGALHDGHLALVDDARRRADRVVVSIFVNPLQFNVDTDFSGYPRPIDDDLDACRRAGVDAVFAPTATSMYPPGFQTRVLPGELGEIMEGLQRPGHFEGVLTVVAKLFGAVRPDVAVFGQKDYQQLRIITQMAADLDLGIDVIGHRIVRDQDGLAMSSRNALLEAAQRDAAVAVPRALDAAIAVAHSGGDVADIVEAAHTIIADEGLAELEYVTVFDSSSLVELDVLTDRQRAPGHVRIAIAAWFGSVRLIDNRDLFDRTV